MTSKSMEILEWPANSPDLNPIENLWAMLKENVAKRNPKTKEELKTVLLEEWDCISQEKIDDLIDSMPKRINQCLAANGGHTSY